MKNNWKKTPLSSVASVDWGNTSITKESYVSAGVAAYSAAGQDGFVAHAEHDRDGVVVSAIGARCGRCFLARGRWTAIKNTIVVLPDEASLLTDFFYQITQGRNVWPIDGGAQPFIGIGKAKKVEVQLPPLSEQRKIADILAKWDDALEKLDALIAAKDRRKTALMQQLLTGRRRIPGFDKSKGKTESDKFGVWPADWTHVQLGEITREVSHRNKDGDTLPVLSCTKHRGLVRSEEYFGKRVFAEDTSGYRVVRRGEFGYATNHIEEGSIGYQDLCEAGLVSPIYTVFKTKPGIVDRYLFRVLKSPLLIHLYQVNTSASVDRRGSLRYKEFAKIKVWLPPEEEQSAIADVLDTCDAELDLLRRKRDSLDRQKRGLMQRLLTGRIRVKTP